MGWTKHDDRAYPPSEAEQARAWNMTAGVKAKERRIAELEDLVHDLIAPGPVECDDVGRPYCCRWCRLQLPTSAYRIDRAQAARLLRHTADCPHPRAQRALARTP